MCVSRFARRALPRLLFACLALCALALAPAVWAQSANDALGLRDRIEIKIDEQPGLGGVVEVAENGAIDLPTIGSVDAVGLSPAQLETRVREQLVRQGLRNPTVRVRIVEYRSRPVVVLGAVAQPGNQTVPVRISLLEVLLRAGGLNDDHGGVVHVRRRASNGLADQLTISVDDLVTRADPAVNVPIRAGDLINVPAAMEITVHLLGEIENPGSLSFRDTQRVTLLTAIARAGGLTETAANKIRILRPVEGRDQPEEIIADYRQILAGKQADIALRDEDILVVRESFF
ncbi:MAG: polysaccharide biosynthesis/export family protein [Acidobacteriota bacterium]